jgi:hypothetical protein
MWLFSLDWRIVDFAALFASGTCGRASVFDRKIPLAGMGGRLREIPTAKLVPRPFSKHLLGCGMSAECARLSLSALDQHMKGIFLQVLVRDDNIGHFEPSKRKCSARYFSRDETYKGL